MLPDTLTARFVVDPAHPALAGHFPSAPIVPAVMLLERIEHELLQAGKTLLGFERMKFLRPVAPGETVDLTLEHLQYSSGAVNLHVGGDVVARGRWLCQPA
jgi:3-hydroxyacyl-[acyl-carrier-protein] dehydratase